MVSVQEAEHIILSQIKDYGTENIPLSVATKRVLAEDLLADRDMPPYNRATVDGIAIKYAAIEQGITSYHITGTQAAGDDPIEISKENECVEIMTGAALPASADTIIRYEDVDIKDNIANVNTSLENLVNGQNIHYKGKDKKQGAIVASAQQVITPAIINIAATIGKAFLNVKRLPRTVIISTGDELVAINDTPLPYQIRSSNSPTIAAILLDYGIAADTLHIPDNIDITKKEIARCLQQYDVILLSGGISMGKFDYVPQALKELSVAQLFHKVAQRPGKPFWFGAHSNGTKVFAFPGNPVSTFMCVHRYFIPWLRSCLRISQPEVYAMLDKDINFTPALSYFLQVKLHITSGAQLLGVPIEGNGSGDLANLLNTDAFMELPLEQTNFKKGEVYKIWPYKNIFF